MCHTGYGLSAWIRRMQRTVRFHQWLWLKCNCGCEKKKYSNYKIKCYLMFNYYYFFAVTNCPLNKMKTYNLWETTKIVKCEIVKLSPSIIKAWAKPIESICVVFKVIKLLHLLSHDVVLHTIKVFAASNHTFVWICSKRAICIALFRTSKCSKVNKNAFYEVFVIFF